MRGFKVGLLAAAVVAADALSILGARSILGSGSVDVFPGLVVRIVENSRGPFGLGPLWLTILGGIVMFALIALRSPWSGGLKSSWPFALIVGGGLANFGERVFLRRTTDLFVLGGTTALNVADVGILVGAILVVALRVRAP